jgi:phosphonate transport system substrate-binding protein
MANKIDLSQIRVLANTSYYPGWLYAHRKGLDPKVLSAVRNALLKIDCMNPEYRPICDAAHFAGLVAAKDSDYDPIRALAAKVGINLEGAGGPP